MSKINVVFIDHAPRKGEIILTCYGHAWTASFDAMPFDSMFEFFMKAPEGYMEVNLSVIQFQLLKSEQARMERYLSRIVRAVREFAEFGDGFLQEVE
jgi:hypothetical protein